MIWTVHDVTRSGGTTITFDESYRARPHYDAVVASPRTWFAVILEGDFIHDVYTNPILNGPPEAGGESSND